MESAFRPNSRALTDRGSRRRVRQLRARDYWTRRMSWLTAAGAVLLLVLLVWLASREANVDRDAAMDGRPTIRRSY
jgi:hypothetical protein